LSLNDLRESLNIGLPPLNGLKATSIAKVLINN
jgi:hypothetical protein